MANDGRNANWEKWRADQRSKRRQVERLRRERDSVAAGPVSYFAKYGSGSKQTYDPLKDPNVDLAIRESKETRRKNRLMSLAESIVKSGGASSVEIGGSDAMYDAHRKVGDAARKEAREDYLNSLKSRQVSATKSYMSARESLARNKERFGLGDLEMTGLGVADRMWNKYKHDQAVKKAEDRQNVAKAGGVQGPPGPSSAMGGFQYTGPGNTPYKAGSGSGRKVHEYAAAKAREAQEHAMYVAERSAQLKAQREESSAKGDFIRRNYGLIQAQERAEAEQRRMETLVANRKATAMQVANEAMQAGLEPPEDLTRKKENS